MPQKKAKKAKAAKPKKPAKTATKIAKSGLLGSALKKAAKSVAKSVGLSAGKKGAAKKPAKPVPAKAAKLSKKDLKKAALAPQGKKAAALPPAKPLKAVPAGKGKKEVVLVVPAPKGVALLTKEGKKKGKSASEGSVSRKNRCREPGCEQEFILTGYCRLHYIKNWRRIKRKEAILASGQLNNYVEELVNKYPDKYLDVIRQDLATEKEWGKVVVDLELEAADEEGGSEEEAEAVAESVRPASGGGGSRGDFDDEGDAF
ncbi:MAG TPA: hypothetical protein VIH99_07380 [Bdellovibrionota bacterium]|jgi:hypothetical protein